MNIYEYMYTCPFAAMQQMVSRSFGALPDIELRSVPIDDPDYVQYDVWNKTTGIRLGNVEVIRYTDDVSGVAFQVIPLKGKSNEK